MILGLFIKADLENIDSFRFIPGVNWEFDIKESTGFEIRNNVYFNSTEIQSIPNSRGKAHFIVKWKESESRASVNILEESIPYTQDDSGKFKCIAKFEVRGLNLLNWHPGGGFEALRNDKIYPVSFQDNSWADYDQDSSTPLSILELEYNIEKI